MFLEHIYNVNAIEPEGHNGKTHTCTHTASEKWGYINKHSQCTSLLWLFLSSKGCISCREM